MYLYDNQIEVIENLGFAKLLSYLYLQNNLISTIGKLDLSNLTKIYLDNNSIEYVSGFEGCCKLEELHLANQRMPQYVSLEFDTSTLDSLSATLQVLEISGNSVMSLEPFSKLRNLRKLFAENNLIPEFNSLEGIVSLHFIEEAKFSGNPCCHVKGYRDFCIGASSDSLTILDDLPILKHQQVAMRGLQAHRRKIGAAMISMRKQGDLEGDLGAMDSITTEFLDSLIDENHVEVEEQMVATVDES